MSPFVALAAERAVRPLRLRGAEHRIQPFDLPARFLGRLWANIERRGDGCWNWTGYLARGGYGRLRLSNGHVRVPRVILAMALGRDLRPGMVAAHRCDNPRCCRPSHLYEATAAENAQDRVRSGILVGERGSNARLSEQQAREIIAALAAGETRASLASRFGVSRAAVQDIDLGRRWRHLPRTSEAADARA